MPPIGLQALQHGARLLGHLAVDAVEDELGVAENGVERRAQLVAHIGEELRFVFARLSELTAFLLDLAEQPRVLDREHGVGCEGLQKLNCTFSSLLKNPRHSECIVIQFFYHESAGAGMRGAFMDQGGLFSYIAPEARVPANHPLRKIRELVRDVLGELNRSLGKLYASEGRPSIPPEQLLSALLLQVFYGIRSERQLMEQ